MTNIVDEWLQELEQSACDLARELANEFLQAGGRLEDLPRVVQPIFDLHARHRVQTLARLQATIERHDGRAIH